MSEKVLITGASRGIGRSIAAFFAKEGYDLILTCREKTDLLNELSSELQSKYKVKVNAKAVDVADYEAVKALYDECGDVDILINNAGIAWMGLLADMERDDWEKVLGTNLGGIFNTCKFFVPGMVRKKKGSVINISSVWGDVGASCEVAYSASKGGVNSFTKALAKELAPSGVRVNAIACGVIDTDMNRDHLSDEELKELEDEIPMGRMGDTSEVAELVLSVAKGPEYLTGQIITVDGGWI